MNNAFLKFYWSATTKYKIHSPFAFQFLTEVLEDDRYYHFFGVIETYRRNLLTNSESVSSENGKQTIHQLTKNEIDQTYGQILFKAVHLYKPDTIVELGTGLGIATLYQATPASLTQVYTFEKNTALAKKTRQFFQQFGRRNITIAPLKNVEVLEQNLSEMGTVDFILFNDFDVDEGLELFEVILKFAQTNTVVALRTPYENSAKMQFWEQMKKHSRVRMSIDIFGLGFLFFRSQQKEVEHFKMIESWKKPWMIY
ncbi:MAG: hypothetical protein AAF960_03495 [Bacteroidota bacterium]